MTISLVLLLPDLHRYSSFANVILYCVCEKLLIMTTNTTTTAGATDADSVSTRACSELRPSYDTVESYAALPSKTVGCEACS